MAAFFFFQWRHLLSIEKLANVGFKNQFSKNCIEIHVQPKKYFKTNPI